MKITKNGKIFRSELKGKCLFCECEIECSFSEATIFHHIDKTIELSVKCPECNRDIFVETNTSDTAVT